MMFLSMALPFIYWSALARHRDSTGRVRFDFSIATGLRERRRTRNGQIAGFGLRRVVDGERTSPSKSWRTIPWRPLPFASGGRLVALAAALFRTEVEKKIYARVARGSNKQFLIYGQT